MYKDIYFNPNRFSLGGVESEGLGSLEAGEMAPRGVQVSMINNHNFDLNELPTEHE